MPVLDKTETAISNGAAIVAKGLTDAEPVIETIVGMMYPGAGAAAALATKIAAGVAAGVPDAINLYAQFTSGTVPTQAELDAYAADESSSYATMQADITKALAKQA